MMHEPDHEEDEETEDAEVDEQMDTGVRIRAQQDNDNSQDEYSTGDQPAQPSFYDHHGFDERDGPPEENEERGYVDDPSGKGWDKSITDED